MIDKTLNRITQEVSDELGIPQEHIIAILNSQHDDILSCAKNKDIDFVFLKYFGTLATHANYRRPFRNDKHTKNE